MPRGMKKALSPLGERLNAACVRAGMEMRDLAYHAHLDTSHLYRITRGETLTSRITLLKICRVLHCTLQEADEIFLTTEFRSPSQSELDEAPLACPA